jgi:hypothetical protein
MLAVESMLPMTEAASMDNLPISMGAKLSSCDRLVEGRRFAIAPICFGATGGGGLTPGL